MSFDFDAEADRGASWAVPPGELAATIRQWSAELDAAPTRRGLRALAVEMKAVAEALEAGADDA